MRVLIALAVGFIGCLHVQQAMAQGLDPIDAINSCESFVEGAIRPEFSADFKNPYKVVCYFGLIDSEIHQDHRDVCTRVSSSLGDAHRQIAEFMCTGAYEAHINASDR